MNDTTKTGMTKGLTSYGDDEFSLFLRKAFIKAMGFSDDALDRPIIGIANTYSDYSACHKTVPDIVEAIKRGVMLAGGLPLAFPTTSMHESFASPTSMFLRNLMAMDAEEMIRAQPMDSVVLIGGCDKTVPALLMGAASAGVPAILEVTGPMLSGSLRGERLGACTDCRRLWAKFRAGDMTAAEIAEANGALAPTAGTCGVMGTASTMALAAEAMGMLLPGGATIPAVHSERLRHAELTGARAVAMAAEGQTPDTILTPAAFENALRLIHLVGGSTNALVHLVAMAGRLGHRLDMELFDRIGRDTPVLVDLKPSGQYYMDDLHRAGGFPQILRRVPELFHLDAMTVTGQTLGSRLADTPEPWEDEVIRSPETAIFTGGAQRVLRGNLAPHGALIKQSAASPALLRTEGRAVVFTSLDDMAARIDSDDLDVRPDDVLVLKNAGPKGAPGMPEAGYIPIPRKLARQGVKDMLRMSDARMSGTAYGSIVLHIAPEAAVGGPIGLVENGDRIRIDVDRGELELLVDAAELARRREKWTPPTRPEDARGYRALYMREVLQADEGCDFGFLQATVAEDETQIGKVAK